MYDHKLSKIDQGNNVGMFYKGWGGKENYIQATKHMGQQWKILNNAQTWRASQVKRWNSSYITKNEASWSTILKMYYATHP